MLNRRSWLKRLFVTPIAGLLGIKLAGSEPETIIIDTGQSKWERKVWKNNVWTCTGGQITDIDTISLRVSYKEQ